MVDLIYSSLQELADRISQLQHFTMTYIASCVTIVLIGFLSLGADLLWRTQDTF